ncbi:SCO6880 family protein [Nocardioides terrisoli]|uniref:SCO6880 family protein n=1 Tax=Nocardioides terrisoli TaxID=3388267 RepID=UPI00287B7A8C|nr:SCO6880 family protein [Nocardioides marmorisolisilvae]
MTIQETPTTYTFGRRDRGGLLIGFTASQICALGCGFAAVLFGVLAGGTGGALVGCLVLGVMATLALFPVQGRPLVDWARPIANHLHARLLGDAHYLGGFSALRRCDGVARMDLPGLGQSLRLFEARTFDGPVAAMRIGDRWTVVLRVRGANYVLADRASQERRISAWGALLSQSGQEGSRIAAVQWLERTVPDSGHDLKQWWDQHGQHAAPYAGAYARLIERAGPAATRHESFVAVAIDAHRLRRPIRQAGGGPEGTTKVLMGEIAWVRQALGRADIDVLGVAGAKELATMMRGQFDPASAAGLDTAGVPSSPVAAGPMAAEPGWDHYRTDSAMHAVYWISQWPSVPVEAAWVYPLIALGGIRRTVSVTAEPIAPSRSLRELRSQRVAKRADEAQRRRLGQVETAQDDEEYDALERRERELVRGHTEYRFTGWITVTAADLDELESACSMVEQAAVRSALEVRRVYGEVDQAFLRGGLPLTQGVAR